MSNLPIELLKELAKPFHPSAVTWKPGAVKGAPGAPRALALAYADVRAYQNRLDAVCGSDWSITYEQWGNDRLICRLTILGVTRSSTGEMTKESERSEIGGTVAEAQAFKRACAMFGLGRYLYNLPTGWADYDPAKKAFTEKAKAKLVGILMQHYRSATNSKVEMADVFAAGNAEEGEAAPIDASLLDAPPAVKRPTPHERMWGIGKGIFGPDWDMARPWLIAKWSARYTPDNTRNSASELTDEEKTRLADYMNEKATDLQRIWPNQKAFIKLTSPVPF